MNILNKVNRPLVVPLPRGKKLHLGPGKSGQIHPNAATHPALLKMIEAGEVEITDGGRNVAAGGDGPQTSTGSGHGTQRRTVIKTGGDRSS